MSAESAQNIQSANAVIGSALQLSQRVQDRSTENTFEGIYNRLNNRTISSSQGSDFTANFNPFDASSLALKYSVQQVSLIPSVASSDARAAISIDHRRQEVAISARRDSAEDTQSSIQSREGSVQLSATARERENADAAGAVEKGNTNADNHLRSGDRAQNINSDNDRVERSATSLSTVAGGALRHQSAKTTDLSPNTVTVQNASDGPQAVQLGQAVKSQSLTNLGDASQDGDTLNLVQSQGNSLEGTRLATTGNLVSSGSVNASADNGSGSVAAPAPLSVANDSGLLKSPLSPVISSGANDALLAGAQGLPQAEPTNLEQALQFVAESKRERSSSLADGHANLSIVTRQATAGSPLSTGNSEANLADLSAKDNAFNSASSTKEAIVPFTQLNRQANLHAVKASTLGIGAASAIAEEGALLNTSKVLPGLQTHVAQSPRAEKISSQLINAFANASKTNGESTLLKSQLSSGTSSFSQIGQPDWPAAAAAQLKMMFARGTQSVELQLNPASLGSLNVVVERLDDQSTKLLFSTQTPQARELIEAQLPRLREIFDEGKLNLLDVDVRSDSDQQQGLPREHKTHLQAADLNLISDDNTVSEHQLTLTGDLSSIGMLDVYA